MGWGRGKRLVSHPLDKRVRAGLNGEGREGGGSGPITNLDIGG